MALTLEKLYTRGRWSVRPSAWWTVKGAPGITICRWPGSGWKVMLVAEQLGLPLPWPDEELAGLIELSLFPHGPRHHLSWHTQRSWLTINLLAEQVFVTRREALAAVEAALGLAESQLDGQA